MNTANGGTGTLSLFRLFDPEWADPYAYYREIRQLGPVHWDEWMRTWLVLDHDLIQPLFKDERLSGARIESIYQQLPADARSDLGPLARVLGDMMLFNEPPRHTRLRSLIRPGLTPRFIRDLRPVIAGIVDELLDKVLPTGEMDLVRDLSEPLTREVIARLAGIGGKAVHLLESWQGLLIEFFTQSRAQLPRLAKLRQVYDRQSAARRDGSSTDLFSSLVAPRLAQAHYTEDEIFGNFVLLIDAGQATTTHQLANCVLALLKHPDQLELLRAEPELGMGAAHELLRYDSAVQYTNRVALDDLEVAGTPIRKGQSVALVLGAGNRDPEHYPEPDRLDLRRQAKDHLSFGFGIHYCLGASLAVTEIELALAGLLRRTKDLRLAEPAQDWLESVNFRFLRRLPVRFTSVA